MPDQGKIEELTENLKSYFSTNFELIKYQGIERSSVIIADLVSILLVGLILLFFVFFTSLWACFYLSTYFGNNYSGIAIVAGFYLLLGLLIFMVRKKLVVKPLRNKIIREMLQKD
jgi:hypothetical protein